MHTTAPPPIAPSHLGDVQSTRSGILAFRPIRNEAGELVDLVCTTMNEEATAILNKNAADMVGRSIGDIHPKNLEATLLGRYAQVVETGEPLKVETEYMHHGQQFTWSILATRGSEGLVLQITDTAEQRRQAALLQERDRLQTASHFVRLVGHEVRNPLTNILLALDQLEVEGALSQDQLLYVEMVRRNAKRIDQLINELLHSSRELEAKMVPGPLNAVLSDALANVKDRCELRGAKCTLALDTDLEDVPMERSALTIAFTNLLVNAVEAMELGKGELSMHTERSKGRILVTVSDNGRGMTEEERERIFLPFFSGRKGGLGLGLTEARNIFNAHDILLTVDSESGKGSSFKLLFPQKPSPSPHDLHFEKLPRIEGLPWMRKTLSRSAPGGRLLNVVTSGHA